MVVPYPPGGFTGVMARLLGEPVSKVVGQSVIFEAWEQGLGRARPERLAGYVETIALPVLTRRLGALLNLTGAVTPAPLRSVLEQARHLPAADSTPQVPLFRGQSGTRLDPEWNVLTPA